MRQSSLIAALLAISIAFSGCVTARKLSVATSDPAAEIYLDGKLAGTGAISLPVSARSVELKVTLPDYDPYEFVLIKDQKTTLLKKSTLGGILLMVAGAGTAGLGLMVLGTADGQDGQLNYTVADIKQVPTITTVGIVGLLVGAAALAAPLFPYREWKPEYKIDMASLARYDPEGYERVSGYDRWGVDRNGAFRDGGSFSGTVVAGSKEGWGSWIAPGGESFTGSFSEDRLEGLGLHVAADGARFYGGFTAGEKAGRGVLVSAAGTLTLQQWEAGVLVSEKPQEARAVSGDWIYLGESASAGLADGIGAAARPDLSAYLESARWSGGLPLEGKLLWPEGRSYAGPLADSQPAGRGSLGFPGGLLYEGEFKAGLPDGTGVVTAPGGGRYEGGFSRGLAHGPGLFSSGAAPERCEYYNGQRIDAAWVARLEGARNQEILRSEREKMAAGSGDANEIAAIAADRLAEAKRLRGISGAELLLAGLSLGRNLYPGAAELAALDLGNGVVYLGEASASLPEGQGRLSASGGSWIEGTFRNGKPEGPALFFDGTKAVEVLYRGGRRVDVAFRGAASEGVRKIQGIRADIQARLARGLKLEDANDLVLALAEQRASLDRTAQSELVLYRARLGDGTLTASSDSGSFTVALADEEAIRDATGKVLKVVKEKSAFSLSGQGLGLASTKEEITRYEKPIKSASFTRYSITGNLMYMSNQVMNMTMSTSMVGAGGGIEYRKLNNGGRDFPGPAGGKGGGLDLRGSATLSLASVSTSVSGAPSGVNADSSSAIGQLFAGGSLGWSSFKFGALDQTSLQQKGSGWTLGARVGLNLNLGSENASPFTIGPLFSFDSYRYNPGTAKYKSSSFNVFLWPYPINLSLAYTNSF